MSQDKKILVIGGRGALGQALIRHFKQKNVWVASVDHGENKEADASINTANIKTTSEQAKLIEKELKKALNTQKEEKQLDGIICVAGGWRGGNILEEGFLQSVDMMWKQSVESSVIAAHLAGKFLKEGGLVVLTGAQAALRPTPGMIGYGMAKAAVHHLVRTLASEGSGLPKNSVVVGLLPRTLDTPNNRKFAADNADFGSWTPLNHVTGLIDEWMEKSLKNEIKSGSLMEVITKNGETKVEIH